jgi:hypothetical protein
MMGITLWWEFGIAWRRPTREVMVTSQQGILLLVVWGNPSWPRPLGPRAFFRYDEQSWHSRWHWWPGYLDLSVGTLTIDNYWVPLWMPAAGFAAPAAWLWSRNLARRYKDGCCRKCGYALSGLAPATPCPECGTKRTN